MASHECQSPCIWSVRPCVICPYPPPFWSHPSMLSLNSIWSRDSGLLFKHATNISASESWHLLLFFFFPPGPSSNSLLLSPLFKSQWTLPRWLFLKSQFLPASPLPFLDFFFISTLYVLLVCYLSLEHRSKSRKNEVWIHLLGQFMYLGEPSL